MSTRSPLGIILFLAAMLPATLPGLPAAPVDAPAANVGAPGWEQSYKAGFIDGKGHYAGGSEILHLVGHKGKLYAAASSWMDPRNVLYGGKDRSTGWAQILRLDRPGGPWEVDLELGPPHVRPEIIKSITFTSDGMGRPLAAPVNLLLVSTFSRRQAMVDITVFIRDDASGAWSRTTPFSFPKNRFAENHSVRAMLIHRDRVTGVDRVFLSVGIQGIFSGVYDPAVPGKIRWEPKSESGPVKTRPLAIIEANGSLLFSAGTQIYSRNDGAAPSYTLVLDVNALAREDVSAAVAADARLSTSGGIRGLSAVPNPNGQGESLLFMWAPGGRSRGAMNRLDPDGKGGYTRTEEIRLADVFSKYLGGTAVTSVLGAYNNVYPVIDPATGQTVHLVGCECHIAGHAFPQTAPLTPTGGFYAGALYAIRDAQGRYRVNEVNGPTAPGKPPLVAARTCVLSPFAAEKNRVLYFGGNDCNWAQLSPDWAWVFKTTVSNALRQDAPKAQRLNAAQVRAFVNGLHYPFEHAPAPAFTVQIPSQFRKTESTQAGELFRARAPFATLSIIASKAEGEPRLGALVQAYLTRLNAASNGEARLMGTTIPTKLADGTPALEFVCKWFSQSNVGWTSHVQVTLKDGYSVTAAISVEDGVSQPEKFFRSLRFKKQ